MEWTHFQSLAQFQEFLSEGLQVALAAVGQLLVIGSPALASFARATVAAEKISKLYPGGG